MAYKPTASVAQAEPRTREDFIGMFGANLVLQAERIVNDAIVNITRSRAYFRDRVIIQEAQRLAEQEVPEKTLGLPHFKTLLEKSFEAIPMVALDTRGTLTTPDMMAKESNMLALAGEQTPVHVLPESTVDEALAGRCWVTATSLPTDFLSQLRQRYPRASGTEVEVRVVVACAKALGYEVYGAGLTWNRPHATGLSAADIGSPEEFLEAIQSEEGGPAAWFLKPVLFLCDDWQAPAATRLAQVLTASPHPVITAQRTGISDEQVDAVIAATLLDRRVSVIEGTAGAGKSFTMKSVCESYMARGYDVMGAALGWSAAKVLSGSTGLPEKSCRAMEGFLNGMRRTRHSGAQFFSRPTVIIVDEAGMVGTRHMHDLLEMTYASVHPVKIVLTGDSLQVSPVEAGNALEAIIEFYGTTRIDTIRRQRQASHRLAVRRFSQQRSGEALYPFVHQESIRWSADRDALFNKVVRDFVSYRLAFPDKKALVLALKNDDVVELNKRIREIYKKAGFIEASEVSLEVTDGRSAWRAGFAVGDEVVLRANDQNLPTYHIPAPGDGDTLDERTWVFKTTGVFNRNAGRIVGIRRSSQPAGSYDFVIDLEGDDRSRVLVNSQSFRHENRSGMPMVHNFATTIYASQGMTVPKTLIIDSERMNFRLAYVGMSRHTDSVDIYLDETELHLRLDRMMGKSPSRPIQNQDPKNIGVELGRYSRAEMLQTVAATWGRDAENLTATIFARRAKGIAKHRPNASVENLAQVRQGSVDDPVMDFIPSINVAYPEVDIESILRLPDPISETDFERPSDVEENRAAVPTHISPVRLTATLEPSVLTARSVEGDTVFARAVGWLKRLSPHPEESAVAPEKLPGALAAGHHKPTAAFQGAPPQQPAPPSLARQALGFMASLTPKPRGIANMPLMPSRPLLGGVGPDGGLRFDNVPQTSPPEGSEIPGPSETFLASASSRVWWDIGRYGEPRVLARAPSGEVVARYALDGRCVVGPGYPPIAYAVQPSDQTPIHIVPGPREWFLLQELYREKYKDQPGAAPHVVWGARDVDWKSVAAGMRGRKVVVIRSRHDQGQVPWARDLAQELGQRWGVEVTIAPRLAPEDLLSERPVAPARTPSRPRP